MAARPKSAQALVAASEKINAVMAMLQDVIVKSERVIAENPHLVAAETAHYKDCIRAAKKRLTILSKLSMVLSPAPLVSVEIDTPAPKRRGRPPKVKTETVAEAPKRRGRPPKVKTEDAIAAAPKKRGRKPKAKIEAAPAVESLAATEERIVKSVEAPRKRGRPKGSKNKPKVLNGSLTASQLN